MARFESESTIRPLMQSSDFADCCKTAPYIGGGIICMQHGPEVFFFDCEKTPDQQQKRISLLRFPLVKVNDFLSILKNARPCSICGLFFEVNRDGGFYLNTDPIRRCDGCNPHNVNLADYFWGVIPVDAPAKCCDNPEVEPIHDEISMVQLKCSNCELTVYEDVSMALLRSVADKGADSPLLLIWGLSMLQQWNDLVADGPTTTKIYLKLKD